MKQYRQGDVFLMESKIPQGAVEQKQPEQYVLAEGEATGHAHKIAARNTMLFLAGLDMYLRVLKETQLRHEEHAAIPVPPGDYMVKRQREYSPKEIRYVQD